MTSLWRAAGIIAFWLSWPALYVRLRRTVRVRIVVAHESNVLLVRNWYNSGQWQLPGGGIRQGESPLETARRELAEEVDITLDAQAFTLLGSQFVVRERGLPFRVQPVMTHVDSDQFVVKKSEIVDGKWHPMHRAAKGLSDSTQTTLALVENQR